MYFLSTSVQAFNIRSDQCYEVALSSHTEETEERIIVSNDNIF